MCEMIDSKNLELLKLYYDEWKYRINNLRRNMSQLIVVIFFTSTLPITIKIFNNIVIPKISLLAFPFSGIILTVIFYLYCQSEASRIELVDKKIKYIIEQIFPKSFSKDKLNSKLLKIRITKWIPTAFTIIEVLIAILMIYLISKNAIV